MSDEQEESNGGAEHRTINIREPDGSLRKGALPPIGDILIPKTTTKSALIRWLYALGYSVREIYGFLGCKYQMVRNIVTTIPKRAAREDLPAMEVMYRPEKDMIDEALDGALEASLMEGRRERLRHKHTTIEGESEDEQ